MIPWIQVYSNLIQHPKTTELADELALTSKDVGPNIVAAGMLVSLWLWAAQNATSGDLSHCTDRAIAEAAGYKKKPSVFVAALTKARFLDADRKLHGWEEYATLLMDVEERQREQTRERVAKHRANKKAKEAAKRNDECNVTHNYNSDGVTPCNAPTVPNSTLPNHNEDGGKKVHDTATAETAPPNDGSLFTSFWNAYPEGARCRREAAWNAWKKLNPTPEKAADIMAHLEAWKKSRRWLDDNGQFIPHAENFLDPENVYMNIMPTPAKHPVPKGASGELGAAELEAIQRVLSEERNT